MEHFRDDTMIAKLKKMQVIDMIIAKRLEASGEELKQDPKDIFKVTMPLL